MSKTKMRCITCGKWFQSANAKEVTCPECVQRARKDKLASKAVPQAAPKSTGYGLPGAGNPARPISLTPKQKPAASGTSHWFDAIDDVKVSEPDPPTHPKLPSSPASNDTRGGSGNREAPRYDDRPVSGYRGPGSHRDRDERPAGGYRGPGGYRDRDEQRPTSGYRGPAAYHNAPLSGSIAGGISQRPRQPLEGNISRGPRPVQDDPRTERFQPNGKSGRPAAQKKPRPASTPKPKREKIPPPQPFTPTPEQITQVETRYKELAIPGEFDGIRSQIANELSVPKKAVKQIVKTLRDREHIPSWWESQTYKGDSEEKTRIQIAYEPYLPIPPVGVHRLIADELDLKPGIVYQAIKVIRQELELPQYNDPSLHAAEFESLKEKTRQARAAAKESLQTAEQAKAEATANPQSSDEFELLPTNGSQESQSVSSSNGAVQHADEITEAASAATSSNGDEQTANEA